MDRNLAIAKTTAQASVNRRYFDASNIDNGAQLFTLYWIDTAESIILKIIVWRWPTTHFLL